MKLTYTNDLILHRPSRRINRVATSAAFGRADMRNHATAVPSSLVALPVPNEQRPYPKTSLTSVRSSPPLPISGSSSPVLPNPAALRTRLSYQRLEVGFLTQTPTKSTALWIRLLSQRLEVGYLTQNYSFGLGS